MRPLWPSYYQPRASLWDRRCFLLHSAQLLAPWGPAGKGQRLPLAGQLAGKRRGSASGAARPSEPAPSRLGPGGCLGVAATGGSPGADYSYCFSRDTSGLLFFGHVQLREETAPPSPPSAVIKGVIGYN